MICIIYFNIGPSFRNLSTIYLPLVDTSTDPSIHRSIHSFFLVAQSLSEKSQSRIFVVRAFPNSSHPFIVHQLSRSLDQLQKRDAPPEERKMSEKISPQHKYSNDLDAGECPTCKRPAMHARLLNFSTHLEIHSPARLTPTLVHYPLSGPRSRCSVRDGNLGGLQGLCGCGGGCCCCINFCLIYNTLDDGLLARVQGCCK